MDLAPALGFKEIHPNATSIINNYCKVIPGGKQRVRRYRYGGRPVHKFRKKFFTKSSTKIYEDDFASGYDFVGLGILI